MINKAFEEKKEELEKKYDAKIRGIAIANDVDMGVAWDMLVSNAERGSVYPGAGRCTTEEWAELIEDIKAMRALGRE